MALPVTIANNLPSPSAPWGRQITEAVNTLTTVVDNFVRDQKNLNRANATNTQTLSSQVAAIQDAQAKIVQAQADIQAQQTSLSNTVNYLNGLVTVSTSVAGSYNTGDIPGDQTVRWSDGGLGCAVTLNAPTGRISIAYGVGQITVSAGNNSIIAYVRVTVTTPSGFSSSIGTATRVYATGNAFFGVPVATERSLAVPNNEPVTVLVEFGHWGASTSPTGNAQFATPYVRAQVIPA